MISPSLFGPTSSCLITATFSLRAPFAVLSSPFNLFTSAWCITLSYGFLNWTYRLKNCTSLLHSDLILAICLSSRAFHTLFKSLRNWFMREAETYPAHLFLKSCATLNASVGIQSSISSFSFKLFSFVWSLGKLKVFGIFYGSMYLTLPPLSAANSAKFLNSLVEAKSLRSLSLSSL